MDIWVQQRSMIGKVELDGCMFGLFRPRWEDLRHYDQRQSTYDEAGHSALYLQLCISFQIALMKT